MICQPIIKKEFPYYCEISAGTLFSPKENSNIYYLKLAEYKIEDECEHCYGTNVFYCSDSCVNIETGNITTFKPTTECIIHSKSFKLKR